jgi:hypothetical protein
LCIQPPSNVEIEDHIYNVSSLIYFGEDRRLALLINSKDVDFQQASKLLTPKIRKIMSGFNLTNSVDVKVLVAVHIGKREDPVLLVDVNSNNNSLLIGTSKIPYSNLNFNARIISLDTSLSKGNIEKARILISPVKGNVFDFPFTASVSVTNLSNPNILVRGNVLVEAAKIKFPLKNEFKLRGSGVIKLKYYGPTEKLNSREFLGPDMHLNANIFFTDFTYQDKKSPYAFTVNGKANITNKDLKFDKLQLHTIFGDAMLKGRAHNIMDYVLGNTNGFKTTLSAVSESINIDPLFIKRDSVQTVATKEEQKKSKDDEVKWSLKEGSSPAIPFKTSSLFEFDVTLFSKKLTARKVEASNARINMHYKNNIVNIKSLTADACDGKFSIKGTIKNFRTLNTDVTVEDVDVTQLFREFENFGQHAIVSENLKGIISIEAKLESNLDQKMEIVPESMYADVKLRLKDGHILNYQPFQSMSNMLFKNRDFNDVAFSEIEETFKIRGNEMHISALQINSNILDFYVVDGVYNFKGYSSVNILVPWNNLKKRDKAFIPKNKNKNIEDSKGIKLNFSGPNKNMKLTLGYK